MIYLILIIIIDFKITPVLHPDTVNWEEERSQKIFQEARKFKEYT